MLTFSRSKFGLDSLDLPVYRVDLSCVLPMLTKNREHTIELRVAGEPVPLSRWFVTGRLLFWKTQHSQFKAQGKKLLSPKIELDNEAIISHSDVWNKSIGLLSLCTEASRKIARSYLHKGRVQRLSFRSLYENHQSIQLLDNGINMKLRQRTTYMSSFTTGHLINVTYAMDLDYNETIDSNNLLHLSAKLRHVSTCEERENENIDTETVQLIGSGSFSLNLTSYLTSSSAATDVQYERETPLRLYQQHAAAANNTLTHIWSKDVSKIRQEKQYLLP